MPTGLLSILQVPSFDVQELSKWSVLAYLNWCTGFTVDSILPVCKSTLSCMRNIGLYIMSAGLSYP